MSPMVYSKQSALASRFAGLSVFCGTAHPALGRRIAEELGTPLGSVEIDRFHDGEVYVRFDSTIRGQDVYLIQPTGPPVDSNLMELLVMIDAAKRASTARITAVIPFYGYARQEKKDSPREPITAKLVADILTTAGAHRIVALDLHAEAIQGFFNIPVDHMTARGLLCQHMDCVDKSNLVVVSPDEGMAKKARKIANRLSAPLAIGYKFHPALKSTKVTHLAGEVQGKSCLIVDDMISTAGSVVAAVDMLLDHGAKPEIFVFATHGLFSGEAVARLSRPEIVDVMVTNSLPIVEDVAAAVPKVNVLDVAPLLAQAILRSHQNESIATLFDPQDVEPR